MLWAVSMVRDELDVLPYTLAHLVHEGVDGMIIADNGSVDGTRQFLSDFAASAPIPVIVVDDDEVAYYQSRKMTKLYQDASAAGATWVVPFDADEVWYDPRGEPLGSVFARSPVDCLEVSLFNYFPTSTDPVDEPNPFQRITRRDPTPSVLMKAAVRAGIRSLVIEQGNHRAHAARRLNVERSGLAIGHFPWRSFEQFERKSRNGAQAYNAIEPCDEMPVAQGAHWRGYGDLLEEGGREALRAWYEEWFFDPPIELVNSAVPWRGPLVAAASA